MAYSPIFDEEALSRFQSLILENPLGNFITQTEGGLLASSLPFYFMSEEGKFGTLYAHLGHYNPQTKLEAQKESLVIFNGVDAYITPSWMPGKKIEHKAVPTWDYINAQVYGKAEFLKDPETLLEIVSKITDKAEAKRPDPWKVSDAPEDYVRLKLKGIVGLKLTITKIRLICKMEDNTKPETKSAIIEGLRSNSDEKSNRVADEIERI
ncbi:FMN-binding negative transcriptional regulator [Acetobacteraceae bacterium]|nr:FMN-binding negative transcriptional regulator [Acetobacteraceae bacterium]